MVSLSLSNKRYKYIQKSASEQSLRGAIDIHHVNINGSRATGFTRRRGLAFFLVLMATSMYFFSWKGCFVDVLSACSSRKYLKGIIHMKQDDPVRLLSWSCLLSGFLVMLQSRKIVKKESVIIMPTFGIQLETQYSSGKTVSRFIPMDKILKPVLVECVTPVTCYWSLSLFLCGEDQLTLVFKELHPPLKMLVPIWKALRAVIRTDQSEMTVEEEHAVSG